MSKNKCFISEKCLIQIKLYYYLIINNIMIVNRWKKYKIRPNKRNKSCKNIQIHNEINNYYQEQDINYAEQDINYDEQYINYGKQIVHNEKDCFICLEVYFDNLKTIKLTKMKDYIKECSCDGWIHEECFNKWHNVNKKCPICRTIIVFTKYEYCIFVIYNFKKKVYETTLMTLIVIKYTFLNILFLWVLYKFYLGSFKMTPTLLN